MKYLIYLCVSLLPLTGACTDHDDEATSTGEKAAVTLLLRSDEPTASTPQDALQDVNLYLFAAGDNPTYHFYATVETITLDLMTGSYALYAVANCGRDLGERSREEVETLEYTAQAVTLGEGPLPMAAQQRLDVLPGGGTITVPLQRAVARLDLSYAVVGNFVQRVTIRSVQLCNVASTMSLFTPSRARNHAQVTDLTVQDEPGAEYAASWYLLENRQGTVPGISQQGQKEPSRAPAYATYMRIDAVAEGVEIIYRVYLGENNTDDFNLQRNRVYRLHIRILGINALDARVSTTHVTLDPFEEQYEQQQTAFSELTLRCANPPAQGGYALRYDRERGSGRLRVNGYLLSPGEDFTLHPDNGELTVPVEYTQQQVGEVRLRLHISGPEGVAMERLLTTTFIRPQPHLTLQVDKTLLYAMDRATVRISIRQTDYTGKYAVTCTGTPSLFLSTSADLSPATSFTVPGPGDYNLRLRPEQLGANAFRVTVQDDLGQTASATGTITGLKRTATFTVRFDNSVEGELNVMVQGDYPVQEDLYLIVKPTLQIRTLSGSTHEKVLTMPVFIQKGRDVAGYNLSTGVAAGETSWVSTYATTFSRTTSQNGMVDYRVR